MDSLSRYYWPANVVGLLRGKIQRVYEMNIEHKTTPTEHWIVDGKAYRLATEADVGKEVYFDDIGIKNALSDTLITKLKKITEYSEYSFREENGVGWRLAYIQDDSLLTPQRVPVPALGDGWFLLTAEDEFRAGDKRALRSTSGAWIDHQTHHSNDMREWIRNGYHAARYFGVTEPAAEDVDEAKPEPAGEPAIDWTKPVRTKDGRAVRVLCTDGPGEYPVVGFLSDAIETWMLSGKTFQDDDAVSDIENIPPEPKRIQKTWWMNVLEGGHFYEYSSKEEADSDRTSDILACVPFTIDCLEGEGLDVQP